ncbi:Chromosome segregation protein SMC [uncultured Desulfobacterium sp.]|uniref:Chromosome segregation protein SMC n=1 Tax=uncultured Desulfobacterium sp. TaxID=201089 RepID=A0A445MV91_9BACT|nr:Chromosome segregation protein SMC [uncultured Desulfobacterium sp.]
MKIESLRLKNFKMFHDVEMLDIPNFCVIIGANGTGKSTLFDVFGFLKDCLTYNVTTALQSRGGFKELVSRGTSEDSIVIELQYRMPITGVERLVTYHLEVALERGRPIISREILRYKRGRHGSPYHFLDFTKGSGYAILNEEDFSKSEEELQRESQNLDKPDILAIKGLGQFQRFKAANAFRQLIENWHVSDFHINLARGSKDIAGYADHLSVSGDNLQLVANRLFETEEKLFKTIIKKMKMRVPGISAIEPEPTKDGRLLLKFQDGSFKDPFIDKYVSDGTIKMFAYLILLHDPQPHPLLCVEEPENQLYPKLLWELAEEFRDYANRGGQVFVSTHSPDFLNAIRLEEVFWLVKKDGYAEIRRARDDKQISDYMAEGDQMGYLWEQGFFEGADPR